MRKFRSTDGRPAPVAGRWDSCGVNWVKDFDVNNLRWFTSCLVNLAKNRFFSYFQSWDIQESVFKRNFKKLIFFVDTRDTVEWITGRTRFSQIYPLLSNLIKIILISRISILSIFKKNWKSVFYIATNINDMVKLCDKTSGNRISSEILDNL